MSETLGLSKFQIYWRNLKLNNPGEYEARLSRNRNRIKARRHAIYADNDLHEALKEKNRNYYHRVVSEKRKNLRQNQKDLETRKTDTVNE